jgi:hypothetical protein
LGPFSIHSIDRHAEQRERYVAEIRKISINWPFRRSTAAQPRRLAYWRYGRLTPSVSTAVSGLGQSVMDRRVFVAGSMALFFAPGATAAQSSR